MTSHPSQQRSWTFYNDLEDLHAMPATTRLRSHTLLLISCPLCSHILACAGADLRHFPGSGPCFSYFFSLECSPDLLGMFVSNSILSVIPFLTTIIPNAHFHLPWPIFLPSGLFEFSPSHSLPTNQLEILPTYSSLLASLQ